MKSAVLLFCIIGLTLASHSDYTPNCAGIPFLKSFPFGFNIVGGNPWFRDYERFGGSQFVAPRDVPYFGGSSFVSPPGNPEEFYPVNPAFHNAPAVYPHYFYSPERFAAYPPHFYDKYYFSRIHPAHYPNSFYGSYNYFPTAEYAASPFLYSKTVQTLATPCGVAPAGNEKLSLTTGTSGTFKPTTSVSTSSDHTGTVGYEHSTGAGTVEHTMKPSGKAIPTGVGHPGIEGTFTSPVETATSGMYNIKDVVTGVPGSATGTLTGAMSTLHTTSQ